MSRRIKILDRKFIPAGTVVIEQGAMGGRAFMIEKGRVEVFTRDSAGNVLIVAELGPQAMFGEAALMADGVRKASVRTVEDTVLVTITGHDLQKSIESSQSLYERLKKMMSDRLRDTGMKLMRREKELTSQDAVPPAAEPQRKTLPLVDRVKK